MKQIAAQAIETAAVLASSAALAQSSNKVAGVWHPVSATMEANGKTLLPFGPQPHGKLVFTADLHYVELLNSPCVPRFKSSNPAEGTDAENKAAITGSLALYGRYSVDEHGNFTGNTVEGSSFPNWIGDVRTTKELTLTVEGGRMTESFHQPGAAKVTIVWQRASD